MKVVKQDLKMITFSTSNEESKMATLHSEAVFLVICDPSMNEL